MPDKPEQEPNPLVEATKPLPEKMEQWIEKHDGRTPSSRMSNGGQPSQEQTFRELAEQWRRETGMYSSISKKVQHPAYRRIIDMGEDALPWILQELRDRPAHWFTALSTIVKDTSISEPKDPRMARETWLAWGKERGLI